MYSIGNSILSFLVSAFYNPLIILVHGASIQSLLLARIAQISIGNEYITGKLAIIAQISPAIN